MSRRLMELCLLAYPAARRERDREYMRDLALELAERDGLARQAGSLLLGGLKERIEARRLRGGPSVGTWARRALAACAVLAVVALASGELAGAPGRDGASHETEAYACVEVGTSSAGADCAEVRNVAAARERDGWDCTTSKRTTAAGRETGWDCMRGSPAFSWLPL